MGWEAIGAIGETVGAVAVVMTLLYLARQTRVNARAVAGSSAREVWLALSEWNREVARDENLNKIGIKSLQPEMQDFTAEEWHNFMTYSSAYFSILEADWVNHDLDVGYDGVHLYQKSGFITSCPA